MHTASIITLMMKVVSTSEMSVYFSETTWRYIPEGCHFAILYVPTKNIKQWISFNYFPLQK
jgi:hypothetical protein